MVFFSADPTPNSTHIHTTCPRVFSREERNYIYNFTWRVDFSEAVLSGVNNFEVNIFQLNPQGNVRGDIIFRTASRRFIPENVSNDTTRCKIRLAYYNVKKLLSMLITNSLFNY